MEIRIKTAKETISITLNPNDTVEQIEKQVQKQSGISSSMFELKFNNKTLEKQKSLRHYDLVEGSTVILISDMILVKTLSGKVLSFEYDPDQLVKTLKANIEKWEGIPQSNQVLIYAGQALEDGEKKLSYYKVIKDSMLYLVQRLPGGILYKSKY